MSAEHEEVARKINGLIEEQRGNHHPVDRDYDTPMCAGCLEEWPCPTALMLDHYTDIMEVVTFLRDPVLEFAREMEKKLRRHDGDKQGWNIEFWESLLPLFISLDQHKGKLLRSIAEPRSLGAMDQIISDAADVANFAMMIADNASRWKELLKSRSAPATSEGDPDAPE
jgi:hypothetical protein